MNTDLALDSVPLWVVFVVVMAVVLLSIRGGFQLGLHRRRRADTEPEGPIGSVVGAMLGLLAFILAFTFGIAAGRFDARKQLVLDEVNAIGTTVLRADLLPEPHRTQCRRLLKEYVDIRAQMSQRPQELSQTIDRSEALQDQLWSHAISLAKADLNSDIGALFVESLNEVIDLHTSRVTVGLQYRIPLIIWVGLLVVTVFSMAAVGYQFGLTGRSSLLLHFALALTFSVVVFLIADLDRATQGVIKVSQQPMLDLQRKLNAPIE